MPSPRRSVLAMAVLSMLDEQPMHAYRMQQLVKERHKDEVVNVTQRTSVYQTVQRLQRDGLVEVASTERLENRPERTTYRITTAGRSTLREWLRGMLAIPAREFPEFPAALSFLPSLARDDVEAALTERVTALAADVERLDGDLAEGARFLPRVFLVEAEYLRRVRAAELEYVRELLGDVRAGRVTWEG